MSTLINQMTPEDIRTAVAEQYGRVAREPDGDHPFPVGRAFAEDLGYAADDLDVLPGQAVAAFAGISNPLRHAKLLPGETVLDMGCGAGMDTILMARQVGPAGAVHALDLSDEMLRSARASAAATGLHNVTFHRAPAEAIPLDSNSVDAVIVNGIFNLCPVKEQVMAETFRALRPGGRLLVSEIMLREFDGDEWVGETCDLGSGRLDGQTLENWFQ